MIRIAIDDEGDFRTILHLLGEYDAEITVPFGLKWTEPIPFPKWIKVKVV